MSSPNDEPLIPDRADDDRDTGWGERSAPDELSERDREILQDRPPHW